MKVITAFCIVIWVLLLTTVSITLGYGIVITYYNAFFGDYPFYMTTLPLAIVFGFSLFIGFPIVLFFGSLLFYQVLGYGVLKGLLEDDKKRS